MVRTSRVIVDARPQRPVRADLEDAAQVPPAILGSVGTAWSPETRLYSDGVVRAVGGGPLVVPPHSNYRRIPGTCYLDQSHGWLAEAYLAAPGDVDEARTRLAQTVLPGRDGPFADLAETALLDMEAVCLPNGAAVAAGSQHWYYVWPRDAGYLAVAFSILGRHRQAQDLLQYVASVQEPDGTWQARYLPDGSGRVPDDRGRQLDNSGWFLWATWVEAQLSAPLKPIVPERLWGAASAALRAVIDIIDPVTGLPPPSQDYWEVDVDEVTLGVAAPLLLTLRTGADIARWRGEVSLADAARATVSRLEAAIRDTFGGRGYPRIAGRRAGADASIAFLLPPFAPADQAVEAAWRATFARLRLDNGGLRPGQDWPDVQTAWTPQTSLFAMTAAVLGDTQLATELLEWLAARTTRWGSLPEKVTADGHPAAVAPLPLTSATVLIALAALDGRRLPVPRSEPSSIEGDKPIRTDEGTTP